MKNYIISVEGHTHELNEDGVFSPQLKPLNGIEPFDRNYTGEMSIPESSQEDRDEILNIYPSLPNPLLS